MSNPAPNLITLSIPLAPSINAYYRSVVMGKGKKASVRVLISAEGRLYQSVVALSLMRQLGPGWTTLTGPIQVEMDIYMERRGSDADNRAKACLDALQEAGVFDNDKQICDLHLRRFYDRDNSHIDIRIKTETNLAKIDAWTPPVKTPKPKKAKKSP